MVCIHSQHVILLPYLPGFEICFAMLQIYGTMNQNEHILFYQNDRIKYWKNWLADRWLYVVHSELQIISDLLQDMFRHKAAS